MPTTFKSDQITALDAEPRQLLNADVSGGRVRRQSFTFTGPAGNAAAADLVQLCRVPVGARLFGGEIAFEAMSTGGGDASIQLGDGTTAAKYLGTTSVDAAGRAAFGNTIALAFMEKLTAELVLTATVVTEAWAATKKLYGYVEYIID